MTVPANVSRRRSLSSGNFDMKKKLQEERKESKKESEIAATEQENKQSVEVEAKK